MRLCCMCVRVRRMADQRLPGGLFGGCQSSFSRYALFERGEKKRRPRSARPSTRWRLTRRPCYRVDKLIGKFSSSIQLYWASITRALPVARIPGSGPSSARLGPSVRRAHSTPSSAQKRPVRGCPSPGLVLSPAPTPRALNGWPGLLDFTTRVVLSAPYGPDQPRTAPYTGRSRDDLPSCSPSLRLTRASSSHSAPCRAALPPRAPPCDALRCSQTSE